MSEEQQIQLTEFLALFAWMLKEGSAPRQQAEIVLQAAASCMLGVVFKLSKDHPEAETIAEFAGRVIATALTLQYEPHPTQRMALQA